NINLPYPQVIGFDVFEYFLSILFNHFLEMRNGLDFVIMDVKREGDHLLCDIKTVSPENDRDNIERSVDTTQISDQQKTIPNTHLPMENLNDSDEIELTKNQNIELDLIRDLQNCMLIALPDPIEIPSKDIIDNEKPSSKITTQSLIYLFKKAIRSGHQEILFWICYSDNFENKVIEIRHKARVNNKTARTKMYKEMLEHLP
ncbi:34056_t:CDS:2, partial [Racocetra persica]